MGGLRRKSKKTKKQSQVDYMQKLFASEVEGFHKEMKNNFTKLKSKMNKTDSGATERTMKSAKKTNKKKLRTSKSRRKNKNLNATISAATATDSLESATRALTLVPTTSSEKFKGVPVQSAGIAKDEVLPYLLKEFPSLHLSSETMSLLWKKGAHHISQISAAGRDIRTRTGMEINKLEEAARRQDILIDLLRKELTHNNRLKDVQKKKSEKLEAQAKERLKRQQSAEAKRYFEECQMMLRSKQLRKRNREELIFKKLFEEGLVIQKEKFREMKKYVKDEKEQQARTRQDEIDSLENYYRDQLGLLADELAVDRYELGNRERAQQAQLDHMKVDLRRRMQCEIKNYLGHMMRDDAQRHFQQLDADKVRDCLAVGRFVACIE